MKFSDSSKDFMTAAVRLMITFVIALIFSGVIWLIRSSPLVGEEIPIEAMKVSQVREFQPQTVILEREEIPLAAEPEDPEPEPAPELDETEVEMLACAIYCEAGGDACSDQCRYYVGDVILNRVNDSRFPDTIEGVLTQKSQYGRFYWTGIVWPERANYPKEAVARAYDTARALLSGEHSELYGAGYIWQAEFTQGTDVIYLDGTYFGK